MFRVIFISLLLIFSTRLLAQDCEPYFPMEEGASFEISSYDKKGKLSSVATHEVVGKKELSNGLELDIDTHIKDKKGKDIAESSYSVKCEDGVFYIDMDMLLNSAQMQTYAEMDASVEGNYLDFPSSLSVGQKLNDGSLKINMGSGGIGMNMKINVTDREVVAKESITTPAGTFECFKLTFKTSMKMGINMEFETVEWYAKNVGMVRSESYRKGKLQGYSELTAMNK